jgi:DNA repair exonuclease SbcCD ATPase subunit
VTRGYGGVSEAHNTAIKKLTDELDVVRRAWRQEGGDLRQKMLEVHHAKIKSDERAFALESELKMVTMRLREEVDKKEYERQRLEVMYNQAIKERKREAQLWQQRVDGLSAEVEELRRQSRSSASRNTSLVGAIEEAQEEAAALRRECESLRGKASALEGMLADERASWQLRLERVEADSEANRRSEEHRSQEKAAHVVKLEARLQSMEKRALQAEVQSQSAREAAAARESELQSDMAALLQRAELAEDERVALRRELAGVRELYSSAQAEFQAVADAVDQISH